MGELYLIVQIAGKRVAIPGSRVQSVVELGEVVPIPLAPAYVAGLTALRSRALTVIDTRAAIGASPAECETEGRAAIVEIESHAYALLVDRVEDVAEAGAAPAPTDATLGAEWDRIAIGCVDTNVGPAVVVEVAALVAGREGACPRAA